MDNEATRYTYRVATLSRYVHVEATNAEEAIAEAKKDPIISSAPGPILTVAVASKADVDKYNDMKEFDQRMKMKG